MSNSYAVCSAEFILIWQLVFLLRAVWVKQSPTSSCSTGAGLSDYKPARWRGPMSYCSTDAHYKPARWCGPTCCCSIGAGLSDYKPARWCGPMSCYSTGAGLSDYKPARWCGVVSCILAQSRKGHWDLCC